MGVLAVGPPLTVDLIGPGKCKDRHFQQDGHPNFHVFEKQRKSSLQ